MTDPTFAFYRILGNDLPPRHSERQTIDNLHFILDHETSFPGCEKRWVVNRIADAERESEIISILTEHRQKFLHIPFDLAEYATRFLDAEGMPTALNSMEIATGKLPQNIPWLDKDKPVLSFEWLYRHKNLYGLNVNGARNAAIEDGIASDAAWVMAWDGGCFLTPDAYGAIRKATITHPQVRYIVVPVMRLADNQPLLQPGFVPRPEEEPQIIFRRDARDRFDGAARYNNMDKAELLARIGVPGRWHVWPRTPWEEHRYPTAYDQGSFAAAGWAARLAPRTPRKVEAGTQLWFHRFTGIAAHFANLDARLIDAARKRNPLNCYGPFLASVERRGSTAAALQRDADRYLGGAPPSVADKPRTPQDIGRNNYVSFARRVRQQVGGIVAIRDNVEQLDATPDAAGDDRHRLQRMIDAVTALALAGEVTGERRYGDRAALFVRTWCVENETKMNPHLRFAQIVPDQPGATFERGVVDFRDFWALCDALRLLETSGALNPGDAAGVKAWFRSFHQYLGQRGGALSRSDVAGVLHDLLSAAVAAYCDDIGALGAVLSRATLRIHRQLQPWGPQLTEIGRGTPLHGSLFALQGLIGLAWIGRNCGIDLWKYSAAQHRSIPMAVRFLAQNRSLFADYAAASRRFDDRIELALRAIPDDAADVEAIADVERRTLTDPAALGAADGVPPWWQVLLATEDENAYSEHAASPTTAAIASGRHR